MKTLHRIVIIANGRLSEHIVSEIRSDDLVIGVDRAAYWLIAHHICPHVALGDFDSVTQDELEIIKRQSKSVVEFPAKKDATDLELAIDHAMNLSPTEVLILGAIGTRLDHSFVAVQLLEKYIGSGISVLLRDEKNECVMCNSLYSFLKNDRYTYFSLLPITDTVTVSISGCAYPLTKKKINRGVTLGVSNECISEKVIITVHKGRVLIIRSND